jgi:tetratricopeptide (TPR) repeat protein
VRLFNVLLHSANSFLVYRFIRSFNSNRYAALLAGLLFALHPLNSETVNFNAGGRNTMLATFFVLAAYLLHQWSIRKGLLCGAFAGATLFLAGLFSKETALALLPFIGIAEISGFGEPGSSAKRRAIIRFSPYLVSVAIYLLLRNKALLNAGVSLDVFTGLMSRLLDNAFIIPRYLLNVVWPTLLSPKYYVPEDLNLFVLPLVLSWLCICTVLWWLFTDGRSRISFFGLTWMVAFWLPVSGLFPIPSAPLADRYLYLPAIGLWLVVADQIGRFLKSQNRIGRWGLLGVGTVLVVLATVTIRHNRTWHNDIALFSRLIDLYPENAYGYHNLGCAYLDKEKNLDLAEKSFERALALDPYFPRLRTQMGYARLLRGDLAGALSHYNQAIYQNALDSEALLNRGDVLERLGKFDEALDSYRRFLATPGSEFVDARVSTKLKVIALSKMIETN